MFSVKDNTLSRPLSFIYKKLKKIEINFKKAIDKPLVMWYNSRAFGKSLTYGGIAQLARATGSYPVGHGFKSNSRYQRPVGQAAKTPPFHGGNGSSILPRVTKKSIHHQVYAFFADPTEIKRIVEAVSNANLRLSYILFTS